MIEGKEVTGSIDFAFNNFHDAPSATPFVSHFCIVAGGGSRPVRSESDT